MLLYQKEPLGVLLNPLMIFRKLRAHRAVLRQLIRRNIDIRHKGSYLGKLWPVLNPLIMLAIYAFVFELVFQGRFGVSPRETRLDFALGVFLGLAIMQLFLETLNTIPQVIVQNANFVKKVAFPLELLPLSSVGAAIFHCGIAVGLALLTTLLFGPGLTWSVLWLPVILLPLLLLTAGLGWLLAALGVFARDLPQVTQVFSVLLMFFSAIFYPPSKIPPGFGFLKLNPLLQAVDMARNVVLWHGGIAPGALAGLYAWGLLSASAGYAFFCRMKPAFADVL